MKTLIFILVPVVIVLDIVCFWLAFRSRKKILSSDDQEIIKRQIDLTR